MRKFLILILFWTAFGAGHGAVAAEALPFLRKNGQATQLFVNNEPYLILGGELHNSAPSSPNHMAPLWERLAKGGVRTVIGVASWELVEPKEGQYDFTAVDDQIRQARKHNMHLVLIWFGAYKNAESTYAPTWVRRDLTRFPRALRDPASSVRGIYAGPNPILSVFSDNLVQADARAFAALMRHVRAVDVDQIVIMVQVENEVGLLGDSRDRSAIADAAWRQPVPAALMSYLRVHRAELRQPLAAAWARQGQPNAGTWSEVFGADRVADEIFMAWAFGRYVERVAQAGDAEYGLPMYSNAWLGPQPGADEPGEYPSGGPVAQMMDVWKAAAPSLALLAPDIYVDDFAGVLAEYHRPNNPVFIPEAKFEAGNLFVALGEHAAIGFSPFGIEDAEDGNAVLEAYRTLAGMDRLILKGQAEGRIRGFRLSGGKTVKMTLGNYTFTVSPPRDTHGVFGPGTGEAAAGGAQGYGLILQTAEDEFVLVGRGVVLDVTARQGEAEIDTADEGRYDSGRWVPGRRLNGDERRSLLGSDRLEIVKMTLLRR